MWWWSRGRETESDRLTVDGVQEWRKRCEPGEWTVCDEGRVEIGGVGMAADGWWAEGRYGGWLFVVEDFDGSAVLGPDVDAVGLEVVEVGAGRCVLGSGVPPVGLGGDIAFVENAVAVAVVDGEFVVFETIVFYQSANDKAVVYAVAVGGDQVGE